MISIVIPLYNKEQSIAQTLDSVLRQEGADFEIVIVDDGSTDRSYQIAAEYARKDKRIHLYQQENGGPSKARNTGVRKANGEWILFLDADDELLPKALTTLTEYAVRWPDADMLLMEVMVTDGKTSRLAKKYRDGRIKYPFLTHYFGMLYQCSGSTAYRKAICEAEPFNEQFRRYEDLDRLFRLYRKYHLYTIGRTGARIHFNHAAASHARKDISEDFVGHLNFHGKSFWERMVLFGLYLGERDYYPGQCHKPTHYYDLLLMYKMLGWIKRDKRAMALLSRFVYGN